MSQLGSQDEEREEPKKTVRQDSVELEKQKEDLKQFHKTFNVSTAGLCTQRGHIVNSGTPPRGYESITFAPSVCYSANSCSASTNIDQSHSHTFECN